ncbi:BTAD domain-containing putative transcriptional regulator [Micromonospora sp. NBC_01638]|uniref:AfsR/SARP family transcriptional regulator n=1 Tax=Micromonospora sp. NBC_01638 TaxID=2975982 RepID=UPI0038663473|nr:transcriptional regulator [Micromonospora sp. NBC_01638]
MRDGFDVAAAPAPAADTAKPATTPEVRVLGPVEVLGPAGPAVLSGSRQRVLVGLLALHAGATVAPPRLIDAMWGDDPPRTALKTLYSHVTRVRRALADCGLPDALTRRSSGYLLAMPRAAVDAYRFEEHVRLASVELASGGNLTEAVVVPAVARLRAALALWRGDVLADANPAGWAIAEAARLQEMRLSALEDRWDAELRLGHRPAVSELERLVAAHPYRERLVGLHMLALHRCGRHADALNSYLRLRAGLAENLGIDPGAAVQQLHAAILRRSPGLDPPSRHPAPAGQPPEVTSIPRPAQLPAPVGHFIGRTIELDALERMARERDRDDQIAVISGPAGMGKTALAVQFAHRVADHFPDGQIFVDLRGHDRGVAATVGEVLCQVLRSLGVPAERTPTEPMEQTGLYRSLVAGRRILIVLDNAGSVDHVLPLVPATTASLLVVTSRSRLTGLTWHAIRAIVPDVLTRQEAVALLERVVGRDRIRREPDATTDLVELCGQMPLALRIAAATLAADGHTIGELVLKLATEGRLSGLSVEDDSRSGERSLPAPTMA